MSFALSIAGLPVSISEVPSGLACGCTCPGCGEPLVAKKGKKRDHHFSHSSGSECASGYESSLHLAVKAILERTKKIVLPECFVRQSYVEREVFNDDGLSFVSELAFSYHDHDRRLVCKYPDQLDRNYPRDGYASLPGGLLTFDRIAVEQREGDVVPDIIGYLKDRPMYIEVAVTHFVDDIKMEKLRKRDVSTVEIDFSDLKNSGITWDQVEEHLVNGKGRTRWLWNQRANALADQDRRHRESRMAAHLDELAKHFVTHRSEFETSSTSEIRVVLCPSYVGVTLVGELPGYSANRNFHQDMTAARAIYDKATNQWRLLPATEEYWLRVERGLRHRYRAKHAAWTVTVPPADKARIGALMAGKATPQ